MFKIIKDGACIGMTENPNYIKQAENGCYTLCPTPEASGIAFEGAVYRLLGRDGMEGVETVMLEETDAGTEIVKATETGGIMFVTMAESGSIDEVTAGEHADLFSPWAYPVNYPRPPAGGAAAETKPYSGFSSSHLAITLPISLIQPGA